MELFNKLSPEWRVIEVEPMPDYTLKLLFNDGKSGVFDMNSRLNYECYEDLKDRALFNTAYVEYGTVSWANGVDIAPECLYENVVS